MPLESGSKLGPYQIVSALGRGGMGEVYKAKDTRLDRVVAIKVLPSHLADNPELRERFEREARAVSSLNHPHICTLYDIGRAEGIDFLVMEYLEGESLADRVRKGALPLPEALRRGIEIAEALDKPHREGVVHRDLKPGNIMLTPSGAKLLDFGLARRASGRANDSPLSALPTREQPLTRAGTILGTFQYMAPEQLEGKEADRRTDIFAFGAVLYEMLTGRKAFEGKSQASLISAIMSAEPAPMATLQPMIPQALNHLVRLCLAKDPEKRWQTAADVARELEWIAEAPAIATEPLGKARAPLAAAIAFLAGAALAALGSFLSNLREAPPRGPAQHYSVVLAPDEQLQSWRQALALSPDGRYLVYAANNRLHLRPTNIQRARPLNGTHGARGPFFSPDGQWIGFWADGRLKRISVTGGAPVTICEAQNPFGSSWAENDTIVFGQGPRGIFRVSGAGGNPEPIVSVEAGEWAQSPLMLPGARALLYNVGGLAWGDSRLFVLSLDTGEKRVLVERGSDARYLPTGHLVYALGQSLLAVAFDLDSLEVEGSPVPVVENVSRSGSSSAAHFTFSNLGTMVYLTASASKNRLVWMDRRGRVEPLPLPAAEYGGPSLSPSGRFIAMNIIESGSSNLWIYDIEREALSKLTFSGNDIFPIWGPDGRRVTFSSGAPWNLFSVPADGSRPPERLSTHELGQAPTSWSPDGRVLAFQQTLSDIGDIHLLQPEDDKSPRVFLSTPFIEREARFSPDGRFVAYRSDESGQDEVYVRAYPDGGGRQQISTNGGAQPMWNPSGRELFYKEGNKMMAVDVQTRPTFRASKPRVLFESRFPERAPGDPARYAVARDGGRFLVIVPGENASSTPTLNVVVNWFEEIQERVRAKN